MKPKCNIHYSERFVEKLQEQHKKELEDYKEMKRVLTIELNRLLEENQELKKEEIDFLDGLIREGIVCKDIADRIKKLKESK